MADAGEVRTRDDKAEALMQTAHSLIHQGKWPEAAEALEEAAWLHAEAGRSYDQSRCLQLAATLRRSSGQVEKARSLVDRAADSAQEDRPLATSIAAERAETAFAAGQYEDAVSAWNDALDRAQEAGLKADGRSALLRRRAATFLALGQIGLAKSDFDEARALVAASHGHESAGFVRTEEANLLLQYGYAADAEHVLNLLEAALQEGPRDPHLSAEILLAHARLALAAKQVETAAEYARQARSAALEAVAPLSYFAASVELAEALEAQDKLAEAYGALATAWATLSDVLGRDAAQSWVEPCLMAYQLKWGDAIFAQTRKKYETTRRTELGISQSAGTA
jgi:tetratricopeptide (TPR) repeat protein